MNIYSKEETEKVIEDLLNSKTVAFPTDTVFGLACLIDDDVAINKIYKAKRRDINKKLPMMVSSIKMLEEYCELNKDIIKLINKFAPGPLTLILKYKNNDDTVAVRIPNDEWILNLINKINKPLLVTSANISNSKSLISYEDVINDLGDNIDSIVKGQAKSNISSTIVDCVNNYKIIREGKITSSSIEEVLK